MEQLTPTQEALAAHDKLHELGFVREEDWFVKYPGEIYMEQIHVDTIAALVSQPAVGAQPLPAQTEDVLEALRMAELTMRENGLRCHAGYKLVCRVLEATPPAPSEPAQPVPAVEETITVQEAWEMAGGNPGIRATRQELAEALRQLDAACDEAATHPQPAQASAQVPVAKVVGESAGRGSIIWLDGNMPIHTLLYASPVTPGEPAGAQAGAELVEEAMRLATKMMRDSWATGNDAAWQPGYQALRAHLTTMAAIPEAKEPK